MEKQKRISFDEFGANHLYELALEHFQKHCFGCERIKERLETFIGPTATKRTIRTIKKNGYCSKSFIHQ